MEFRLLLLSLVLWAGRVSCNNVFDATVECCASFRTKWEEYGVCVNKYGLVPVCDGSMRGCYYGNRFYKVGDVVQIIPSKCMMLVCSSVFVNPKEPRSAGVHQAGTGQLVASNTETVQIKVVQVSSDCGCCKHEGTLYPDGSIINLDRHKCHPNICNDGTWSDVGLYDTSINVRSKFRGGHGRWRRSVSESLEESDSSSAEDEMSRADEVEKKRSDIDYTYYRYCCNYYGQYYAHGEVINTYNQSYGSNCYKRMCYRGSVYTYHYSCCCIENGQMYHCNKDMALPSSDHETCHIRKCCDGIIETHHEPGCCFYNGQVYKPDQFVSYTSDYCQRRMCRNGVVVGEDAGRCCCVDGVYYKSYEVIEENAEKCILRICIGRNVVDRSLDHCPCCIYNNVVYTNGSSIDPSSCQKLVCVDGEWVPDCSPSKCDYCYVGSHFRTFDNRIYNYNAPCNHTLVQRYYAGYPSYYTISLSFKKCSIPFGNGLTCPDVLTIKHRYNVAITLAPGGIVMVNGNPVTSLPYTGSSNNGPFIYEDAFTINVVIFSNILVQYGKGYNPSVRILAPAQGNLNYLYGLCGRYNNNPADDIRPRYYTYPITSISTFVKSWKTRDNNCIEGSLSGRNCSSSSKEEIKEIETWCNDLFEDHPCLNTVLDERGFVLSCYWYMCSCLPCMDYKCKTYMLLEYATACANRGGIIELEHGGVNVNGSAAQLDSLVAVNKNNSGGSSRMGAKFNQESLSHI